MITEAQRDIARHGQVFTPPAIVDAMLALRRNRGRVLEPACGDGAFSRRLPGCVAIELDAAHCPAEALHLDFFAYPEAEQFDTIGTFTRTVTRRVAFGAIVGQRTVSDAGSPE